MKAPENYAIICAACGGGGGHIPRTGDQVGAFLDEHAGCEAATRYFDVSMPASIEHDSMRNMGDSLWRLQAFNQGFRPFGAAEVLPSADGSVVYRGKVVPEDWREWDEYSGMWKHEAAEKRDAEAAAAAERQAERDAAVLPPGDPLPDDFEWPPGGEPA